MADIVRDRWSQREEIAEEGLKKHDEWKKQLSGAFENKQLLFSFIVLGVFYMGYVAEDFRSGSNNKDEDRINKNCSCKSRRAFYIIWFILCCLLWLIFHTILFVVKTWPKSLQSNKMKVWQYICSKLKVTNKQSQIPLNINRYELFLRVQYYKLYVVGYFTNKEKMKPEEIFEKKDEKHNHKFLSCKNLIHGFLLIFQYIAQLFAIPLLIIQMFDTYTLLCFGADNYCSDSDEYRLNLDQTAITFALYCCLGISRLAAALMQWDPWPPTD